MKEIRIGIIGAGANTRAKHIPGLKAIPGVRLTRVVNRTEASSRKVATEFGIEQTSPTAERLIQDPEVDAVLIGTWPYRHAPYTLKALAAGKHVLTEARLAMDLAEAKAMLSASRKRPKLVAMVVPSPFTLPLDQEVARLVQSEIGKPVMLEVEILSGALPSPSSPRSWRSQQKLSGLNTMTLGIWAEAVMRWFGPFAQVSALTRIVQKTRTGADGKKGPCDVPDLVSVQGTFHRNALPYRMVFSDVAGHLPRNRIFIHGTEASLHLPLNGQIFMRRKGDAGEKPHDFKPGMGWRVEEEFIGAIRRKEKVRHTRFEDGVAYMAFTQAVHDSAKSGKIIPLPKTF